MDLDKSPHSLVNHTAAMGALRFSGAPPQEQKWHQALRK